VSRRQPPRLLVKTLVVIFGMVAALLAVIFIGVFTTVRSQVRETVRSNLDSTQLAFKAVELRRQRELHMQAATVAESPTLKAALETYVTELGTSTERTRAQLLATINRELAKVAAQIESDAIVLVDLRHNTLAAAGRLANQWPHGRAVSFTPASSEGTFDGVAQMSDGTFRVVSVPLAVVGDEPIGALYFATSLDRKYAESLELLSRTRIAFITDGILLASTLPDQAARAFEAATASRLPEGIVDLNGESYAFRRLVEIDNTSFYALGSIDEFSRRPIQEAMSYLAYIAGGAIVLALVGSFSLARMLSKPIGHLSESLAHMARSHHVDNPLAATGSSLELDKLTETFNELIASVLAAEAQTEAAYTGAIRALAAALDARDPYTAGHSERVSVLSVAIGRALRLERAELEVLRLGALLHDIGKIGVPDDVLRKPSKLTDAEYMAIKEHPVLGARILRLVPFLAPHVPIVELHHERPDGRGYPHGLGGDDIPLAARIVHVADAYDAITSARAYRSARPPGEALRELWRCAGTEFHAEIVGALATALPGVTSDANSLALEPVNG
jgi:putative nucleotidyltransferase with HDIG domain